MLFNWEFFLFPAKSIDEMPSTMITFAGGVPNEDTFPFQNISVKLKDGSKFSIKGAKLSEALQYMPSDG